MILFDKNSILNASVRIRSFYHPQVPGPPFTVLLSISLVIHLLKVSQMRPESSPLNSPSIKITRLRFHPLTINVTIPRPGIKAQKPFDGFKPLCGAIIRPYSIPDHLARFGRILDVVICRCAFPFTHRRST